MYRKQYCALMFNFIIAYNSVNVLFQSCIDRIFQSSIICIINLISFQCANAFKAIITRFLITINKSLGNEGCESNLATSLSFKKGSLSLHAQLVHGSYNVSRYLFVKINPLVSSPVWRRSF